MIDAAAIAETIALYTKHGWTLRRVLLSAPLRQYLAATGDLMLATIPVINSELDAAWFSRPSRVNCTAWELRRLSGTPFALVEVIDDRMDAGQADDLLKSLEMRMIKTAVRKPVGN